MPERSLPPSLRSLEQTAKIRQICLDCLAQKGESSPNQRKSARVVPIPERKTVKFHQIPERPLEQSPRVRKSCPDSLAQKGEMSRKSRALYNTGSVIENRGITGFENPSPL
jgi:hypothetical protein